MRCYLAIDHPRRGNACLVFARDPGHAQVLLAHELGRAGLLRRWRRKVPQLVEVRTDRASVTVLRPRQAPRREGN